MIINCNRLSIDPIFHIDIKQTFLDVVIYNCAVPSPQ